jgi:hypothetical protein
MQSFPSSVDFAIPEPAAAIQLHFTIKITIFQEVNIALIYGVKRVLARIDIIWKRLHITWIEYNIEAGKVKQVKNFSKGVLYSNGYNTYIG